MQVMRNTIIDELYKLYAPDKSYGDKIIVDFQLGGISAEDVIDARKFANGLRNIISESEATIEQRNSKVVVKPL